MRRMLLALPFLAIAAAAQAQPTIIVDLRPSDALVVDVVPAIEEQLLPAIENKSVGAYRWMYSTYGSPKAAVRVSRTGEEGVELTSDKSASGVSCRLEVLSPAGYSLFIRAQKDPKDKEPANKELRGELSRTLAQFALCFLDRVSNDVPVAIGTNGLPPHEFFTADVKITDQEIAWAFKLRMLAEGEKQTRDIFIKLGGPPTPGSSPLFVLEENAVRSFVKLRKQETDRVFIRGNTINPEKIGRVR